MEVGAGHPAGVDVQFHTADHACGLEDGAEGADRQGGSADVDLYASGGDAESGAVDVGGLADGGAPFAGAAGGAGRVELSVVDKHLQVLPDAGHGGRHVDFLVPAAHVGGAVGAQDEAGLPVVQGCRGATFAVVAGTAGIGETE